MVSLRFTHVRHRTATILAGALVLGSTALGAFPSFTNATEVSFGQNVVEVLVGDFDNDGVPDIASADSAGHIVNVRRGTGDGTTFVSPSSGFFPFLGPDDLASGKMDADDFPDFVIVEGGALVAVLCHGFDPADASVLKYERQTLLTFAGVTFDHVAAGDFDGNGSADLVGAGLHTSGEAYVVVFLNDGSGAFDAGTGHSVGVGSGDVALADLTRDGRPEIILASELNSAVIVFRNLGSAGAVADGEFFFLSYKPTAVAVADVTGDGLPDVVAAGYGRVGGNANEIGVYILRNTAESMSPSVSMAYVTGYQISSLVGAAAAFRPDVAVADLDGDGDADIAIADPLGSAVSILQLHPTTPGGDWTGFNLPDPITKLTVPGSPQGIVLAEMESTGSGIDFVTAHGAGNGVWSALNRTSAGSNALSPAENLKFSSTKVKKKYLASQPFTFFATTTDDGAPGFSMRVQSSAAPGVPTSWADVPYGVMTYEPSGVFGAGW